MKLIPNRIEMTFYPERRVVVTRNHRKAERMMKEHDETGEIVIFRYIHPGKWEYIANLLIRAVGVAFGARHFKQHGPHK